mmetsp:Transcript_26899/g.31294  ORF Transcript_26899/g.31294 Transcript_26899/m.31294 type:complete len:227 (+) Transcript_26899:245-925(+)
MKPRAITNHSAMMQLQLSRRKGLSRLFMLLSLSNIIIYTASFQPTHQSNPTISTQRHMEPTVVAGGAFVTAAASAIIYMSGSEERQKRKQYTEWEEKDRLRREEMAKLAYIEPRDYWKEEDLKPYDGTQDPDGPILMAVNGDVYNVWKGRHFYGPGCEYHIFAGRDATRLLAKTKVEEESEEEKKNELNMAERAALQGWIFTIKSKYEYIGKLEGFDPSSTSTRIM